MNYKLNRLNKYLLIFLTTTTILFLNGCGGSSGGGSSGGDSSGGDSSGGDSGGNEISTEFSYSDVRVLKGEAVTTSPEWVGNNAPESMYSIDPDLPAGISIDENTGDITGTPATLQVATTHTVTATPPDGADGIDAEILVIVFETRPANRVALIAEIAKYGNTADLSIIDTSLITKMKDLFENKGTFNGDISKWDTSNVTTMEFIFNKAYAFNQPIGDWITSNVTNMENMFSSASAFNQPIEGWDTSKVANMENMFYQANAFNQPIGDWNTNKVTTMKNMFNRATAFNQNLDNWNTDSLTDKTDMFKGSGMATDNIPEWAKP